MYSYKTTNSDSNFDEAKQNATYATEKPSNESGVADFIFKYL